MVRTVEPHPGGVGTAYGSTPLLRRCLQPECTGVAQDVLNARDVLQLPETPLAELASHLGIAADAARASMYLPCDAAELR
jgi:hypothetical protein